MIDHLSVIVVKFGDESTEQIVQLLHKLQIVHRVLLPNEVPSFMPTHVILSGGPHHVYEEESMKMPKWVLEINRPVLAICYAAQLVAHVFGGVVVPRGSEQKGLIEVTEIIEGKQLIELRWMNRYDKIIKVPNNFYVTGVTGENDVAAFTDYSKYWCIQYHPESSRHRDESVFLRFFEKRVK